MNQPNAGTERRSKRAPSRKPQSTRKKRASRSNARSPTEAGRRKRPVEPASRPGSAAGAKATKTAQVLNLLNRRDGATIDVLMDATGWQAHSVRDFLSGTVKKRLKLPLHSTLTDQARHHRIDAARWSTGKAS
jgi:hypothetical protein